MSRVGPLLSPVQIIQVLVVQNAKYITDSDILRVLCGRGAEKPENPLVHAKHNRRTRDGSKEVGGEAAVEADEAFLPPDQPEALDQAGVLVAAVGHRGLSESRSHHLQPAGTR